MCTNFVSQNPSFICQYKQEPVKPGNDPWIGVGHREVVCQKYMLNPTSNNEVMGRTQFWCKVML